MKEIIKTTCPKCGKEYTGVPALSRLDNTTLVCPECGTREALESIGMPPQEIEDIVAVLHTVVYTDKD